ncbi:amidase domain-containing protein [Nostocoides japonicum]|uniref:amidase domain-containing protein n=1 Tax=Nostocoides japonicum TaxID=99481 RepID=UPI000AD99C6D|nr:amidase domain-containing protein [Tetrasphaera japonica]
MKVAKLGLAALLAAVATVTLAGPAEAYDGGDAAAYADTWALSYNSHYLKFGDDCTNFVSQSLHAGGKPFVGYGTSPTSDSVWWQNKSANAWSHSWTVAWDLYQYLDYHGGGGTYEGSAPGTSINPYTPSSVKTGDALFYDWGHGEGVSHSAIQVGIGGDPSSGYQGNYIDEHTSGRKHAFWSLYPYNAYRSTTTIYFLHIH